MKKNLTEGRWMSCDAKGFRSVKIICVINRVTGVRKKHRSEIKRVLSLNIKFPQCHSGLMEQLSKLIALAWDKKRFLEKAKTLIYTTGDKSRIFSSLRASITSRRAARREWSSRYRKTFPDSSWTKSPARINLIFHLFHEHCDYI